MVTCTVHQSDGTQIGSALKVASGARWRERAGEDGLATGIVVADPTAAQLAETVIVRINDGTSDVFAFVPTSKTRRLLDDEDGTTEVELTGPGVRWLMRAGQVYQEDTTDCALPADSRWVGWMSAAFDDSGWAAAASYGTWRSQPFTSVRPKQWPNPFAEFIWATATGDANPGDVYFRKQFTVTTEADYVAVASADDEYRLWIDGTEILSTIGAGKYQWEEFQEAIVPLCPGTHTIAILGRNLDIAPPNPGWIIAAIVEAAGDGRPAAANHISAWSTDAESGTFTIRETSTSTNITVDVADTVSDLQTKIDAVLGAGNTDVSGAGTAAKNDAYDWWIDATGGTYRITVDGEFTDVAWDANAATIEAAVEALTTVQDVTVTGAGTSGDQFRMEFVGADAETSFAVSFSGANLTGGGSAVNETQVSEGTPYDPWLIEGTGEYANTFMHWYIVDQSTLVGGDLTVETTQEGKLARAIVYTDDSWVVEAYPTSEPGLNPGEVLRILVQEARDRGVSILDDVALGFTDSVDSNGNAWTLTTTFELPLPDNLARVIEILEDTVGVDVWMDPDLTLHCAEERGDDLAFTLSPQTSSCANLRATSDESAVTNVIRTRPEEGWREVPDAASVTARGRWESDLIFEEYRTEIGVTSAAQQIVDDLASPQLRTTFDVPSGATRVPHVDYEIGDRPTGPVWSTSGFGSQRVRVDTLDGTIVEDDIDWTVEVVG